MLYRTHQYPLLFPFKPFSTTPLPLVSPPTSIQVEQGMECVEEVELRSSFRTDELNGQNGGVSGDEFVVDDLLDFSTDGYFEAQKEHEQEEEEEEEEDTKPCYYSPRKQEKEAGRAASFSAIDDFESAPCTGLSVPADDLADLEWLSHFVEDSFSEYSLTYPAGKLPEKTNENRSKPNEIPVQIKPSLMSPVHTKARSKRARTGGRVWSLGSPSLTESSPSSSSSSTITTSSSSTLNRWLMLSSQSQTAESLLGQQPPAKRQKRKIPETAAFTAGGGGSQQPRRCSHCLVQKTPQWRTGPLGAKTLCNACGVRFKSGRLLPEYRPACSPTFSSEVHSNNHRKVMEMRRKKEGEGLAQPVQSF